VRTSDTEENAVTDDAPVGGWVQGSLRSTDGAGTVRLDCLLDSDIESVWSALTRPERLGQWLGSLEGGFGVGDEFRARFFATGWEGTCRVETCAHAERLRILTRSDGEPDCIIDVSLAGNGEQTTVVFEDSGLPLDQLAAYGAGDQVLVEDLLAFLAGRERCDAQARWRTLHPGYQELASALG
jgi:hypothetical protein